ncbi:histidinol-phosphate transaminase [Parenemella sanctibonifatiensis]|uniref:Histidinol-phosphate aminotransferase n=1 Tax=Parenemella sanctibonifatiensis TaxID=2016505 RepID=A0A255E570_9ACTN|nr:histidinol-phosphate transaminase [Parenemella sanctibonifatiensis]OYN84655.1 aminotransferase [Parenemella sanctibonifatiensis]
MTQSFRSPLSFRSSLAGIPAYAAGKPAPQIPGLTSFKLSSNEVPFGPLPQAVEAAHAALVAGQLYPDAGAAALRLAIGGFHGLPEDQVLVGSGAVGVLYELLTALCEADDEVVYAWRSFEAYPIAVQLTGASSVRVPLTAEAGHDLPAMAAAITPATKAVIICTPNNPTGVSLSHDEIADFLTQVPDTVAVILDEAYHEFDDSPDRVRAVELLELHPNLVALRTFSKAYGLAGLRIGYGLARAEVVAEVGKAHLPFSASSAAQAAAIASLEHSDAGLARLRPVLAERARLVALLAESNIEVPSTSANFVWLETGERTDEIAEALSADGITARPFAGEGIRVSVGTAEATDRVVGALLQVW